MRHNSWLTAYMLIIGLLFTACSLKQTTEENYKDKPEIKVIYDYAKNINDKKYEDAMNDLASILRDSFLSPGMPDYVVFKNIGHMDIKVLVDKTGQNDNGKWLVNPRNVGEVYDYKVYYAELNYKINNTIESYLKDGINYHKIVVVKETKDSPWQIGEISSVDKEDN